jgi:zinc-finger-containing domain
MKLTKEQKEVMKGKVCPYCYKKTEYTDSLYVYKTRSYGMIYICKPCNAYCGVHKGTKKSLGRVANKALREWKQKAHGEFDRIWKSGHMTRKEAYHAMSIFTKVPENYCHIGMFSIATCMKVVYWASQFTEEVKNARMKKVLNLTNSKEYDEYLNTSGNNRYKYFNTNILPTLKHAVKHLKDEFCFTDLAGKIKFYPKSNKILFCKECRWEEDGLDHFIQRLSF